MVWVEGVAMNDLWSCENAIIGGPLSGYAPHLKAHAIVCLAHHPLGRLLNTVAIKKGKPLISKVCQGCADYDALDTVPVEERGKW